LQSVIKLTQLFLNKPLSARLEDDRHAVLFDGLRKIDGPSTLGDFRYEPVIFSAARRVRASDRQQLAARAVLLAGVQGALPGAGIVYLGRDSARTSIRFGPTLTAAENLLRDAERLQRADTPPKLLLNDHCRICAFRDRCRDQAIREDNLSLLRGISEKTIKRYARKGVLTLTQLAHTFRPRRRGKRTDAPLKLRDHALHALAIRDRTIYVLGAFRLPAPSCVRANESCAAKAKPQDAAPTLAKPRLAGDTPGGNNLDPLPLLQEQAHRAPRPEATAKGRANEAQARFRSCHHAWSDPAEGDRGPDGRLSLHELRTMLYSRALRALGAAFSWLHELVCVPAHHTSTRGYFLAALFHEIFGIRVRFWEFMDFRHLLVHRYRKTYDMLLAQLITGLVLHIDETEVRLKDGSGYVWVFANTSATVYIFRQSREGDFLRKMLKDFKGVLVSDFYSAYDGLPCLHQRCLIHLMRDMNRAILDNPFDQELQSITAPFGALLRSIVVTVDEHGLKRRYLQTHAKVVRAFFNVLAELVCQSDASKALQERLLRNRDRLFTFLQHDGVLWNNNLAENAIKRISDYREDVGRSVKEKGLTEHLVLLRLYQTCRVRDISFLNFLRSRERDMDAFAAAKRRRCRVPRIELYPKGYLPSSILSLRRGKIARAGDTIAGEAE
jgi:hypothetical protein